MPTPEELIKRRKLDEEAKKVVSNIQTQGANVLDPKTGRAFNTIERNKDITNTQSDKGKQPPPFIFDEETGKVSGITKNGKTFFLPPEEIKAFQDKQLKEQAITDNAILANEKARLQSQAGERERASADVGLNLPEADSLRDEPGIDTAFQVAGATGGGIAGAGTVLGAASGLAKLGLAAPVPPQAKIALGIVGLVAGAAWGTYRAISADERDNVEKSTELFNGAKRNMISLMNRANHDPNASPWELQEKWDTELSNLHQAEKNLKKLTDEEVIRFTSGGEKEFTKLKAFLRLEEGLTADFRLAILRPNSNAPIITEGNLQSG